jgi:hypothetical protein
LTPGTILHHQTFTFSDGSKGKKLLVLLTDLVEGYFYVLAKTTSKNHRKGKTPGCQLKDIYPNFFIPNKSAIFRIDTWIGLDEFYEFKHAELIQRHFSGEIKSIGNLDNLLTIDLLSCTLKSKDITPCQEFAIKTALEKLRLPSH